MKPIQHILIAMDSFKGSLSAFEVCDALKKGMVSTLDVMVETIPLADGGEGSMEVILQHLGGTMVSCEVMDPLMRPHIAQYLMLDDGTAIIELAQSIGLPLLSINERNPMVTTSYGFGQMIIHALHRNCHRILLCIGGSATNDGGCGMAAAMGVRFMDANGSTILPCGDNLNTIQTIDLSQLDQRIKTCSFSIVADVTNPLCGPNGASLIYGPQKGATSSMVETLDQNLSHFGNVVKQQLDIDIRDIPGSGAAGGIGGGLMAFCNAKMQSGIETILDLIGFDQHVYDADLVITGEGQIDGSTIYNKVPTGVAKRVKSCKNIPVIAVCGNIGANSNKVYDAGIDAIFSIVPGPISLDESMHGATALVQDFGIRLARLLKALEK